MEFDPGSLLSPETSTDDKEKKEKRKKSATAFKAPIRVESGEKNQVEKPAPSMFDKALADLAIKQRNEKLAAEAADAVKPPAEKAAEHKEPEQHISPTELEAEHAELLAAAASPETVEQAGRAPETDRKTKEDTAKDSEKADDLEPGFTHTELQPNDLPLGEGIVHLRGNAPLSEREVRVEQTVPLRTIQAAEAVADQAEEPPEPPVWRAQEQQQQAQQYETPRNESQPEGPEPSNGSGGDVPPVDPPETGQRSFEQPEQPPASAAESSSSTSASPEAPDAPENPYASPRSQANPNAQYTYSAANNAPNYYNTAPTVNTAPAAKSTEQLFTKDQLEDEVYVAQKVANRRGVISGLLVGGLYEHFKHRGREKREKKRVNAMTKQWEKQQAKQDFNRTEQERQLAEAKRQAQARTEQQPGMLPQLEVAAAVAGVVATTERRAAPPTFGPEASPVVAAMGPERRFAAPTSQERAGGSTAERQLTQAGEQNTHVTLEQQTHVVERQRRERSFAAKLEKMLPKRREKMPVGATPEIPDQLEIPPEHRMEASSWHTIEIDSKTGKPVENPTFQYGAEYYRERAHEAGPRDDSRNSAAGEVALVAAAMAAHAATADSDHSTGQSTAAQTSPGGAAQQHDAQKQSDGVHASLQTALHSTGPIWPWIVAFVVVVVLLIAVL